MTECKKCGGTGEINVPVTEHLGRVLYGKEQCDECDGTGEVQTNEEWLASLTTEEKAKFLFEHGVISCNFCNGNCVEIDYKTKECKYNTSPSYSYTGIVEWLKQPHTPIS